MTESEWLRAIDPHAMIEFLREKPTHFRTRWQGWLFLPRFKISERKWRLFYTACVRRIQHLLPNETFCQLIEVHEKFADGLARKEKLQEAVAQSVEAAEETIFEESESDLGSNSAANWAVLSISSFHRYEEGTQLDTLRQAARARAFGDLKGRHVTTRVMTLEQGILRELAHQATLLRDILGNPHHPSLVDPTWLAWEGGTVSRIAQSIYDARRFEELPILADALEDAGCSDETILQHCRAEGEHMKGCWIVDLLLKKE